jgi:hypothetical protein
MKYRHVESPTAAALLQLFLGLENAADAVVRCSRLLDHLLLMLLSGAAGCWTIF